MRKLLLSGVVGFTLMGSAFAQERGTVEVRGSVGIAAFLDDDEDHSFAAGGSARFYITPRISIEPDFYYLRGPDQSSGEGRIRDYEFNVNAAVDFLKTPRVAPYVFGGGGFQLHRNEFRFDGTVFQIKETRESFGGGIGVRIFVTERVFIAPEARLGWETLARLVVGVGYRF